MALMPPSSSASSPSRALIVDQQHHKQHRFSGKKFKERVTDSIDNHIHLLLEDEDDDDQDYENNNNKETKVVARIEPFTTNNNNNNSSSTGIKSIFDVRKNSKRASDRSKMYEQRMDEYTAALTIQRVYRGYRARIQYAKELYKAVMEPEFKEEDLLCKEAEQEDEDVDYFDDTDDLSLEANLVTYAGTTRVKEPRKTILFQRRRYNKRHSRRFSSSDHFDPEFASVSAALSTMNFADYIEIDVVDTIDNSSNSNSNSSSIIDGSARTSLSLLDFLREPIICPESFKSEASHELFKIMHDLAAPERCEHKSSRAIMRERILAKQFFTQDELATMSTFDLAYLESFLNKSLSEQNLKLFQVLDERENLRAMQESLQAELFGNGAASNNNKEQGVITDDDHAASGGGNSQQDESVSPRRRRASAPSPSPSPSQERHQHQHQEHKRKYKFSFFGLRKGKKS